MAISKDKRYVQALVNETEYDLIRRFAKVTGRKHSEILRSLIRKYLPLEVNIYFDELEAKNET